MRRQTTSSSASASSIRRRVVSGVSAMALAWSLALVVAAPSLAAPGTRVNVEPEQVLIGIGQTVVLTALVSDADGDPSVGTDSNTHVRWYFAAGSPNDVASPGNSPDLQCFTGSSGECSVSYVAAAGGTDRICAIVGGPTASCEEAPDAADDNDNVDVVLRIVSADSP